MRRSDFIGCTVAGAALVAGAISLAVHRYHAVQRGLHAEGTVVGQDVWKPRVRYSIIEFTTARGEKVRFRGATGITTGTTLDVVYDPRKPSDALIGTAWSLWGAPVMIAALGLAVFVPALLFYLQGKD